jgi:hypothetical protein
MKTNMLFLRFLAFLLLVLPTKMIGQVPTWEPAVTLQDVQDYVTCATSDGYGQHILVPNGTQFKHFLVGNDGVKIASNSEHVTPPRGGGDSDFGASITNFGGMVSIVARNGTTQLNVYQSSDGGATWNTGNSLTPSTTIDKIDCFADNRGVHVVWDNIAGNKVYYTRYNTNGTWETPFEITNLNGTIITGRNPKVITSSNKAIVSFVKVQADPLYDVGSSRDFDFSTQTWDNTDRPIGLSGNPAEDIVNQTIVRRGSMIHMLMRRTLSSGPTHGLYEARRDENSGWTTPFSLADSGYPTARFNFRRTATAVDDTCYVIYPKGAPGALRFAYYNPQQPWPTPYFAVEGPLDGNETMSSSRAGVYVFYDLNVGNTKMRRLALAIIGNITTNGFWTGNTWIGNASIEGNNTITMKSGSLTTFLAGTQLTIKNGATLIVEPNAQLAMQSGSKIVVENGGVIRVQQNATLTIPSGGTLQANGGAQFKFGPSSGLLSYGQLNTYGTESLPVSFASVYGGGGTWSGIVVSGSGANGSSLQYATVANVLTYWGSALSVLNAKGVAINHCNISGNNSNGTNGLYLYNATDAMVGYNTINDNAGNGIRIDETGYAYVYNNLIQNNSNAGVSMVHSTMAFGNPFSATGGHNSIIGGNYGVEVFWFSYPWMGSKENPWVGSNSVCSNGTYRVYATDNSIVAADWNWWGTSAPTGSLFLAEGGAQIAWEEYLDYDPNGTCSGDGPLSMKGSRGIVTTSVSDTNDVIFRALRALHNRNRSAARGLLQSAIVSNPNSGQSAKAAAILSHIFRDSLDSDILGMMTRLWQQRRASHPVFGQAIAKMLQQQRRISEAATILNALAAGNRNTVYEKRLLLSLFHMYFTSSQHASLSGAVLQQLQARFGDDPDVKHAAWIYGVATPSNSNLGRIAVEQQQAAQPTEFKLEQNYPNPFNPTTTIRFAIPQTEHVMLKVYDLLGREVATLVDEARNAGSFNETFDASKLASGVYIYKLSAGVYSASRKLIVVK